MAQRTRTARLGVLASLTLAAFGAGPAAAGCTRLGTSVLCDGRQSTNEVGRTLVFPRGPAGERLGDNLVVPEKGGLPRVLDTPKARPGRRPLNRADGLTDPRRGRDFGAFRFPSGPLKLRERPFQ